MIWRSMTGFGYGESVGPGVSVRITTRSVNARGLEPRIHAPPVLGLLEPELLQSVRAYCHRGRVDVNVVVSAIPGEGDGSEQDWTEIDRLVDRLRAIQSRYRLSGDMGLEHLLAAGLGDRLATEATLLPNDEINAAVRAAMDPALRALIAFREREGEALRATFLDGCERLVPLIDRIAASARAGLAAQEERLLARLRAAVESAVPGSTSADRLASEVVLLIERGDIAEELQRAREHVRAMAELVAASAGPDTPLGRRVEFILQELHRELTTAGSKSQDSATTAAVIEAKTIVDRLREQSANLE